MMWGERERKKKEEEKPSLDAFIIITGSLPELPEGAPPGRATQAARAGFSKNFKCHFSFCWEPMGALEVLDIPEPGSWELRGTE